MGKLSFLDGGQMMFWSDVKVHKQAGAHLLKSVRFAAEDFVAGSPEAAAGDGSGFQATQLCQPGCPAEVAAGPDGSAPQAQDEFFSAMSNLREQQDQELNSLLGALASGLEEIGRLRENVLQSSTEDMYQLIMTIAEQVILCEVEAKPDIIIGTLQKALQSAISSSEYHVKLHPDDLAIVKLKKPLFMSTVSGLKNITLEADEAMTRGGCLVESELGLVDATIKSQLDELRLQLLAAEVKG